MPYAFSRAIGATISISISLGGDSRYKDKRVGIFSFSI